MKAFNRSFSLGTEGKERKGEGDRERGDNLDECVRMSVHVGVGVCVRVGTDVCVCMWVYERVCVLEIMFEWVRASVCL